MCTEAHREVKTRPMIDHPSTIHPSEHHVLGAIKSCVLCHSKSGTLARSSISWFCSGDMIYSLDQQVLGVINFCIYSGYIQSKTVCARNVPISYITLGLELLPG